MSVFIGLRKWRELYLVIVGCLNVHGMDAKSTQERQFLLQSLRASQYH
jgi:hypothetical protein